MIQKVGVLMQTCILCDQISKEGLIVCSKYICCSCETELIFTHVDDPFYLLLVDRVKSFVWPITDS